VNRTPGLEGTAVVLSVDTGQSPAAMSDHGDATVSILYERAAPTLTTRLQIHLPPLILHI